MGMNVTNPNNDDVGKIKELVLDPRRSRVSYFVMQSGGFLGMGDKSFAIPWTALTIDSKEKKDKLILNVTKERLEKAPEFVAKDWDRMSDPVWLGDVYKYYGVRPYWETEAPGG
jgi:sporulation protein YlmC with PRC-barrel domain